MFNYIPCVNTGLKINGVLDIVTKYPEAKKYFVKSTGTMASEIMDLNTPTFSTNDNQKGEEEIVIYNLHQFLKNVERMENLFLTLPLFACLFLAWLFKE